MSVSSLSKTGTMAHLWIHQHQQPHGKETTKYALHSDLTDCQGFLQGSTHDDIHLSDVMFLLHFGPAGRSVMSEQTLQFKKVDHTCPFTICNNSAWVDRTRHKNSIKEEAIIAYFNCFFSSAILQSSKGTIPHKTPNCIQVSSKIKND